MTDNQAVNQQMIKEGLTQFIGAYLAQSPLKPLQAKHDTVAMLMEESIRLSLDESQKMEPYVLKPVFKVIYNYYHDCYNELSEAISELHEAKYDDQAIKILSNKKEICFNMLNCFLDIIDQAQP